MVTTNLYEQDKTYQKIHPGAASNKDREPQKDLQFKRKRLKNDHVLAWLEMKSHHAKLYYKAYF